MKRPGASPVFFLFMSREFCYKNSMKKLIHGSIALFGVCAVMAAAPSTGRAVEAETAHAPSKKSTILTAKPSPGYKDRIVYVLSNYVATGSNIPVVYVVYHGTVTTINSQNRSTYGNLGASGSEDVAGALGRFDPSITSRRY